MFLIIERSNTFKQLLQSQLSLLYPNLEILSREKYSKEDISREGICCVIYVVNDFNEFEKVCLDSKYLGIPLIYIEQDNNNDNRFTDYASLNNPDSIGLIVYDDLLNLNDPNSILYKIMNDDFTTLVDSKIIRHFTHISDIINAICFVIKNIKDLLPGTYDIFNPETHTIVDLIIEISKYRNMNYIPDHHLTTADEIIPSYTPLPLKYKTLQESIYEILS